jgi:hypothetical protein
MAMTFTCPQCSRSLRVNEDMIGKKGRCPACQFIFQLLDAQVAEEPAEDEPAPRSRSQSRTTPAGVGRTSTAGPGDREVAEDRSRRPAEDDAGGDNDIIRRRKRRKESRGSRTGLVLALSALGVLLLGGIVLGLWFFLGRSSGPPDELRYLPDNCQVVVVANMEKVVAGTGYKRIKQEFPQLVEQMGLERVFLDQFEIREEDMAKMIIGIGSGEDVTLLKPKKKLTAADLKGKKANVAYREVTAGSHTIHESDAGPNPLGLTTSSFCMLEGDLILFGRTDSIRRILERKGKPKFTEKADKAVGQADFSRSMVMAMDGSATLPPGMGGMQGMFGPGAGMAGAPGGGRPQAICMGMDFDQEIRANISMYLNSSKEASDFKKQFDEGKRMLEQQINQAPPQMREILEMLRKMEVSTSGNWLTMRMAFDVDQLIRLVKQFGGAFGGFGGPPKGLPPKKPAGF